MAGNALQKLLVKSDQGVSKPPQMPAPAANVADALFARIAKLAAMEVPARQIAQACGLTEERLQQLMDTERFRNELAQKQTAALEQSEILNTGWDAIEEEALGTVLQTLQANPDPDYALRAASVANKAQRRNGVANRAIAGGGTAAATITLNVAFIEKLQSMRIGPQEIAAERKRVDRMIPGMVEELMKDPSTLDVEAIFRKHE